MNKINRIYICTLLMVLLAPALVAQHNHEHDEHAHKNDIGIANNAIYMFGEKEWAYGIDAHYIRTINDGAFGIGIGYEYTMGDHKHQTVGIVGRYKPTHNWLINITPGISFGEGHQHFSTHAETAYLFNVSILHMGPVLSISTDFEEVHAGIGLHIGFGF